LQRGGKNLLGKFVYDSHIWRVWNQGSPGNIWHSDNGGWRFVATLGDIPGGYLQWSYLPIQCNIGSGFYNYYSNFVFLDNDRTASTFGVWTQYDPNNCNGGTVSSTSTHASDNSGYYMTVTNYTYAKVIAPDGTPVYDGQSAVPVADTNGNLFSSQNGV